jgi:hypothetical protein
MTLPEPAALAIAAIAAAALWLFAGVARAISALADAEEEPLTSLDDWGDHRDDQ